jgi:hypothetical protein
MLMAWAVLAHPAKETMEVMVKAYGHVTALAEEAAALMRQAAPLRVVLPGTAALVSQVILQASPHLLMQAAEEVRVRVVLVAEQTEPAALASAEQEVTTAAEELVQRILAVVVVLVDQEAMAVRVW